MNIKEKTGLVEESIVIKISDFGKKLLYATYNGESNPTGIKRGCFSVKKNGKGLLVSYTYEPLAYMDSLDLTLTHADGRVDYQTLSLDWARIHFGLRPYFVCACGRRCERLYIAEHRFLSCRECQGLAYGITRVRKTTLGGLVYSLILAIKVEERKAQVRRVSYAGQMTRRARATLTLAQKAHDAVSRVRLVGAESQKI